jgi:hypothetical protein
MICRLRDRPGIVDRDFERDKAFCLRIHPFPDEEYYSYAAYKVYMHQKNYPMRENILSDDYEELPAWLSDSEIYEFTSSSKRSAAGKSSFLSFLTCREKRRIESIITKLLTTLVISHCWPLRNLGRYEKLLGRTSRDQRYSYLDDILLKLYAATKMRILRCTAKRSEGKAGTLPAAEKTIPTWHSLPLTPSGK